MRLALVLEDLRTRGVVSQAQHEALQAITSGRSFSLFFELRALLYLGVIAVLTGVGWVVRDYFTQLGHIMIIGSLTLATLAALVYCFVRALPYSNEEVAPPDLVFDYILYLGCALYSVNVAYIETQFHLLGSGWPALLLLSALGLFALAFRFDNQLVLTLALSTLAAYFGFELAGWPFDFQVYYRHLAILFGLIVLGLGSVTRAGGIKKHFFDLFANFAAHFMFLAALSGIAEFGASSPYCLLLLLFCAAAIAHSLSARNYLFLFYAVIYGYLGLTSVFLRAVPSPNDLFLYFIISPILVGYLVYRVYALSRTGGEEK
jgi:hypothetical protein